MASPDPETTQQEQQPPPLDVDELLKCGTPKPLPFIVTDEEGMFYVDPNTANIIAAINKPLVVVSIVGKYRTGKSFFMNRLAGSNTGFSLGRTIKAQTKGIWVWPRPHPDNDKYLLLLDTEGLGDVHKGDEHHDMWIFVMAVLMSTTLVWNIMGVLDHQSFEQLNFITNMTEHVQTKKTQTEDEQKLGLHNYFPNFIVCIRDFTLELEINSTPCTSDEYLEDCLNAPELENLRKQREMLRTCFKNRKCFVFKRPVEEELINKLENVPDDELRPVFLDTANRFKEYVLQTSTVKQVDSVTLTGHSFLTLVEEYVSNSNNPNFKLCIESTLTHVVNTSNNRAKDEAIEFYNKKMESVKTRFPLPVQELCKLHEDCFQDAMELFNQNSVLDREKTHRKELKDNLKEQYRKWTIKNKKKSQEKCDMTLKELYKPIKAKEVEFFKQGRIKDYYDMMNDLKLKYGENKHLGDEKNNVLVAFVKEKKNVIKKILEQNASMHEKYKKDNEDLNIELTQQKQKHNEQELFIATLKENVKLQTECAENLKKDVYNLQIENAVLKTKMKMHEINEKTHSASKVKLEETVDGKHKAEVKCAKVETKLEILEIVSSEQKAKKDEERVEKEKAEMARVEAETKLKNLEVERAKVEMKLEALENVNTEQKAKKDEERVKKEKAEMARVEAETKLKNLEVERAKVEMKLEALENVNTEQKAKKDEERVKKKKAEVARVEAETKIQVLEAERVEMLKRIEILERRRKWLFQ
ncbi:guanylate-binding protein 1-like isoform X2 [Petromyzon marinus]|uniref:guanylate-binding protein 1-like isoform X2 n=1 Tax=Petromyzon marinus TaxID=7757 RepID=UPI003F72612C